MHKAKGMDTLGITEEGVITITIIIIIIITVTEQTEVTIIAIITIIMATTETDVKKLTSRVMTKDTIKAKQIHTTATTKIVKKPT